MSDNQPVSLTDSSSRLPLRPKRSGNRINTRLILLILGFWSFFVLSALRVNLGVAIVAMVNWTAVENTYVIKMTNSSCFYPHTIRNTIRRPRKQDGEFLWDAKMQGYILSSYFYGLAFAQLPGGRLAELTSAKWVLLIGTLVASVANLCSPISAKWNVYAFIVLQVLKGLGQGVMMPCFSVLMGKWVPPDERSSYMAYMTSGLPFGQFVTVILSGIICDTIGWQFAFYIFGIVGILWCILWGIFIYDSPLHHPYITKEERNRILSINSQKLLPLLQKRPIPVKDISLSTAFWAYCLAGFASFWAICLYMSILPIFMKTILKYGIEENGMLSSFPSLLQAFTMFSSSQISDLIIRKKFCSILTARKILICSGLFGFAMCIIALGFVECNRTLSICLLVMALGMSGFSFSPTAVIAIDLSPRFAGTLSGVMNTLGSLSGVVIPAVLGTLTENEQLLIDWRPLFYISGAICFAAILLFLACGSTTVQPWNTPLQEPYIAPSTEEMEITAVAGQKMESDESRPWRAASASWDQIPIIDQTEPRIIIKL